MKRFLMTAMCLVLLAGVAVPSVSAQHNYGGYSSGRNGTATRNVVIGAAIGGALGGLTSVFGAARSSAGLSALAADTSTAGATVIIARTTTTAIGSCTTAITRLTTVITRRATEADGAWAAVSTKVKG